jgi:hypothetical protein
MADTRVANGGDATHVVNLVNNASLSGLMQEGAIG